MLRKTGPGGQPLLVYLLLLITVGALCVTAWALFFREPQTHLAPDYAPVATEKNAQPIPGDSGDRVAAEPGSGNVSLSYSNEVSVDLSSREVSLFFANPGRSNQDMLLQIRIRDTVILQSGRITPGNQVQSLRLDEDAARMLSPGGYDGSFMIFYYDLNSGEKAMVNTEVPIRITVVE